jgi:hypothetical protein
MDKKKLKFVLINYKINLAQNFIIHLQMSQSYIKPVQLNLYIIRNII